MNRKLIRPNLTEIKDKMPRDSSKKKPHPPSETFAENYYYLKQMNKKTQVAISFLDGETVDGTIEWYDRNCIKLNREKEPNLLVYKRGIKYIYKLEETKKIPKPQTARRKPTSSTKS
jgi:sRNA-binding regulator protein Hfq